MTQKLPILLVLISLFVFSQAKSTEIENLNEPQFHLFILSGQSNMQGLDPKVSFIPIVEKKFGQKNVLIVKDALGGQPIRRWIPGWNDANGKEYNPTGDLYKRLLTKVKSSIHGKKLKSVSFVWMQGERDAREQHGTIYRESLKRLVNQIEHDLKMDSISVVIGRLSDFDMSDSRYPHWTLIRKEQVAFSKSRKNSAWVDTDDLNGEIDDLHYTKAGYKELGARFAHACIKLISSKKE